MPPINSFSSTLRAFSRLSYTSPRGIRNISGPRLVRQPQCDQQRRLFSSSFNLFSPPSSGSPEEPQKSRLVEQPENPQPQSPKRDQPSYDITFTCTPCSARSTHRITKHAYHHGSILITCPSCRNRHIISDHLKIFGDKYKTIEDLMRDRGQLVKKGTLSEDGDLEFWEDGTTTTRAKKDESASGINGGKSLE